MKYLQRINPVAHDDIAAIVEYISNDKPNAAKKQADAIYAAMDLHTEMPLSGGELSKKYPVETDYRYAVVSPYIVFYKIESPYVSFYRVLDGRQDYLRILELQ